MMATPFPTPVTVPLLSTLATARLLDDQDDPDGGNDVADAIECRGQEPAALPHADSNRGGSDLDFGDVLRQRGAR